MLLLQAANIGTVSPTSHAVDGILSLLSNEELSKVEMEEDSQVFTHGLPEVQRLVSMLSSTISLSE